MAEETKSRRARIVAEICRRMTIMAAGHPTEDPYQTTFDVVTLGSPLEGLHTTVRCGRTLRLG